jgi:hypothetical protein
VRLEGGENTIGPSEVNSIPRVYFVARARKFANLNRR